MTRLLVSIAVLFLLQTTSVNATAAKEAKKEKYGFKVISVANKTFGYEIYLGKKAVVRQPTIPSMAGTVGFKTKQAAEKVAQLAISKIQGGQMPPVISVEEMKQLGAIQ